MGQRVANAHQRAPASIILIISLPCPLPRLDCNFPSFLTVCQILQSALTTVKMGNFFQISSPLSISGTRFLVLSFQFLNSIPKITFSTSKGCKCSPTCSLSALQSALWCHSQVSLSGITLSSDVTLQCQSLVSVSSVTLQCHSLVSNRVILVTSIALKI